MDEKHQYGRKPLSTMSIGRKTPYLNTASIHCFVKCQNKKELFGCRTFPIVILQSISLAHRVLIEKH
jgi:hypothetical protein